MGIMSGKVLVVGYTVLELLRPALQKNIFLALFGRPLEGKPGDMVYTFDRAEKRWEALSF